VSGPYGIWCCCCCCCYTTVSEGWRREGTPTETTVWPRPQSLDQRSKMEAVVPKMARRRGSGVRNFRRMQDNPYCIYIVGLNRRNIILSGASSSALLLLFLTSGPDLGAGLTVESPWSSSTPPSLGRGQVAPSPPNIVVENNLQVTVNKPRKLYRLKPPIEKMAS